MSDFDYARYARSEIAEVPQAKAVRREFPLLAAFVAGVATVLWCVLFLLIGG